MVFRRVRIDPGILSELAEAYRVAFGTTHQKPLAAARTMDGWCVLLPDVLAQQSGGEWHLVGWHQIEQGGWNDQNRELRWEETTGRRGSAIMDHPQRVPEVFRERVHASIVVQRHIPIEGTREGAFISARRDLSRPDEPLEWRTRRGRGTPDDEETERVLAGALADLRHDFDI
ncbi:MAG TPA: hypothetical protein GXZ30_05605 [Propionibacterium sp.]|jgi:hypothetical protein|nr:hypothetical protein [Propionibacterium sp.]